MDPGQDLRRQIQTDLLTCPLCRRPYVKPRTLPCHHTFCETCVGRCAGHYPSFPCPSCRHDVTVPVSGVSGFPEDVFLSRLSFKIRTIEEPYVTPYVINECLTHQRQALRFYCQTCEKPLCRECPRGNHTTHKVCHIEEQIERMKQRVDTALSDQRQTSAAAVTSLRTVCDNITALLPQKSAMERHVEALVQEKISAIWLEGETLQQELDSLFDKNLAEMTDNKKDLESMVESLLTFDVEAERELARGGLVDVNRHSEISDKLKIMYETMNRPIKQLPGFQATFVPMDIGSEPLVGYFERNEQPVHVVENPGSRRQSFKGSSEHPESGVASHVEEHTFRFVQNGKDIQNGHGTAASLKNDWEKVELRNDSKLEGVKSQPAEGIRAGTFNGSRRTSAPEEVTLRVVDNWFSVPERKAATERTERSSVATQHTTDTSTGIQKNEPQSVTDETSSTESSSDVDSRARPASARHSGEKQAKGFWVPDHRRGSFPSEETKRVKSAPIVSRQMSEPARPKQGDTRKTPSQAPATSGGPPKPVNHNIPDTMTMISDDRVRFTQPYGVAVSRDGLIAVVDQRGEQPKFESTVVHLFDQSGTFLRTFDAPGCHQAAVDREGQVLVTNSGRRQVDVFDTSGKLLHSFGTFTFPMGIAVSPKDGSIYVTDPPGDRICVYGADMSLVRKVGSPHSRLDERFRSPYFVSADATGRILVSDLSNHCVKIMDSDYKLLFKLGSQGSRPGQLQYPCGVAVDHRGNFIVVDHGNSRVQVFDSSGSFAKTIVTREQGLVKPADVAVLPNGKVVLTDMKGGTVFILHSY